MEETLASPKMAEIDLINNLEKISCAIPNRVLKLEGYILKENYKEQLLQYYQKEFKMTPQYISISIEGPPHRRIFTEGVLSKDGKIVGRGVGKKKQDAQQNASLETLQYFGVL